VCVQMERSRKARASGGGVASQHANMLKALARSRGSAAIESNRYGKYRSAPLVGSGSLQGQGMEVPLERDVTLVFRCTLIPLLGKFRCQRPSALSFTLMSMSKAVSGWESDKDYGLHCV
jgi:hypothetical protein